VGIETIGAQGLDRQYGPRLTRCLVQQVSCKEGKLPAVLLVSSGVLKFRYTTEVQICALVIVGLVGCVAVSLLVSNPIPVASRKIIMFSFHISAISSTEVSVT
jgi:hypothetical protein